MPDIKKFRRLSRSVVLLGILLIVSVFYASAANAQTPTVAPTFDVLDGSAIASITPGLASSLSSPDSKVTVTVPAESAKTAGLLHYTSKTSSDAPAAAPSGMSFASTLFELNQVDASGAVMTGTKFNSGIVITVKYDAVDVVAAEGNPSRLVLYKYDSDTGDWHSLGTSLSFANQTVSATVRSLSFFALVGQPLPPLPTPTPKGTATPAVQDYPHTSAAEAAAAAAAAAAATPDPTATPVPEPTATLLPPTPGDVAPGSGFMLGLLVVALVLLSAGGYYMKESANL